ncbi:hypothetical protein SE23_17620 [Vibrio sinaloensis]|nr:hypothetical protein SE23_17620 [Vibrio sinaloensis]
MSFVVLESQKIGGCLVAYFVSGNLLSKQLKHWCETSPNKAFKTDSQRLAFLLLLQIWCLWHNALGLGGGVVHPLIGR